MVPISRNGIEITLAAVFLLINGLIWLKLTFESLENMAMSAAILCLVVYVSDVMSKVGMSIVSQPFSALSLEKSEPIWLPAEKLILEAKIA